VQARPTLQTNHGVLAYRVRNMRMPATHVMVARGTAHSPGQLTDTFISSRSATCPASVRPEDALKDLRQRCSAAVHSARCREVRASLDALHTGGGCHTLSTVEFRHALSKWRTRFLTILPQAGSVNLMRPNSANSQRWLPANRSERYADGYFWKGIAGGTDVVQ